jgi:hypothetical protein
MRVFLLLTASLLAVAASAQDDSAAPATDAGADSTSESVKTMSGMSILGNEEAPKALVIVPWKSSRLGEGLGISNALDEAPGPVDKEVFMRELHFYQLRSGRAE